MMTAEFTRAAMLVASKYRAKLQMAAASARAEAELREAERALLSVLPSDARTSVAIGDLLIRFDDEFPNEGPATYQQITNLYEIYPTSDKAPKSE